MLHITIPATESWDEEKQEFVQTKEITLQLEHSLVSLAKWESKWCKSFLFTQNKTNEEALDYIRCMTLTQHVSPETYNMLTQENIKQIEEYINAPMTATVFNDEKNAKKSRDVVTAELIYYWMIALQIPPEYQKWHLNRLMTLIKVCNVKNSPGKKMSKRDVMSRNAALNAARKQKFNTTG